MSQKYQDDEGIKKAGKYVMHLKKVFLSQVVKMLKYFDTDRSLFAESVFIPRFCPNGKHCVMFVSFVQLCWNNTQAAVDSTSTLTSEGDTGFFLPLKNIPKERCTYWKKNQIIQHHISKK